MTIVLEVTIEETNNVSCFNLLLSLSNPIVFKLYSIFILIYIIPKGGMFFIQYIFMRALNVLCKLCNDSEHLYILMYFDMIIHFDGTYLATIYIYVWSDLLDTTKDDVFSLTR